MLPRAHRILIPLAALLAILPILIQGPSCGHDFDFHLLSWLEAATQFAHMHYPQWAYTPAWNAGEPRFLFYPPLSWSLGAVLGLILPWKLVSATFTFIALTLSGFTAHRLAARYASANAATLAAVLYLTNPYMLFTAYERTAYGELLAAAWIPLLLQAAIAPSTLSSFAAGGGSAFRSSPIVSIAIPVALLWLTNAPAAVMSCYALAFITLVRLVPLELAYPALEGEAGVSGGTRPASILLKRARIHLAAATIAATILGLALSAFYLVPAAYERRYIQSEMVLVEGMRIADNTLFHHMPPVSDDNLAHDAVLHTASLIAITLLIAIAAAFLLSLKNVRVPHPREARVGIGEADPSTAISPRTMSREHPLTLLLLTLLIAFLLTRASLPIWAHTPELRFLQFPWRLTAILGSILAVFAALALDRLRLTTTRTCIGSAAIAAALIFPEWHLFQQPCDEEDTVGARVALYHSNRGTDPTDEYTPTTADNDSIAHPPQPTDPPYWLIASFEAKPGEPINTAAPSDAQPGPAPARLRLSLPVPAFVILNRRQFPDEMFLVNGQPVAPYPEVREDGLVTLLLPAGFDNVVLTTRHTPDQMAGIVLSVLALLLVAYLAPFGGASSQAQAPPPHSPSARIPSEHLRTETENRKCPTSPDSYPPPTPSSTSRA
jgi:hypothetical protein